MNGETDIIRFSDADKRKYLFLKQIDLLKTFLGTHAISKEQYDISFNGLVTKMHISEDELKEWGG